MGSLFISPSYSPYLREIYIGAFQPKDVITNYDKADILILRTGKNITWIDLKAGVIINHTPFSYLLTDKAFLGLTYPKKVDILYPIVIGGVINIEDEMKIIEKKLNLGTKGFWILKPPSLFGGKGIVLFQHPSQAEIADEKYKGWILQKYIENPLLVGGKKFDIRFFVLETGDGQLYLYKCANLRMSAKTYSLSSSDMATHLTNVCYQQKQGFKSTFSLLDYDDLSSYPISFYKPSSSDFKMVLSILQGGLKEVIKKKPKFDDITTFELYGIDVLFSDDGRLFIGEFNTNPAMEFGEGDKILTKFRKDMITETLEIVLSSKSGKKQKLKKYVKI
jgi:hypothetical protein